MPQATAVGGGQLLSATNCDNICSTLSSVNAQAYVVWNMAALSNTTYELSFRIRDFGPLCSVPKQVVVGLVLFSLTYLLSESKNNCSSH